ncbi:MAG TPA: DUF4097 domain-containing protein [Candidatus Onthoplasma faecipullorum]|nr:DUF4097 domain-containing protein [Candidatus Onthoplasma faecipullorum]
MKKFWKYFLIVLLLILGLFMVGVLYLFFVPGSSLFNITYVSLNVQGVSNAYSRDQVETITIQNRDFPINIVEASSDNISVRVYSNSLGFALVKNSTVGINAKIEEGNLIFTISEPHGLMSNGDSVIELRIPENFSSNLSIINRNSTITLDREDYTIENLYYQGNAGQLNFTAGTISGSLDLELNRSDFTLGSDVATNNNDVTINVNDGTFNASNADLGEVVIETNTRGVFAIGECDRLTESIATAGGRIQAGTIGSINVRTSDTNLTINTLTHGGTIELTMGGNIEIGTTNALTDLITNSGDITVHNAQERLLAESRDGNITINNANYVVSATTTYGDIQVTFGEDAGHFLDTGARSLEATTNNGRIVVSGVENVIITINDNGRAEINMSDVLGVSSVLGKSGSVSLVINKDSKYNLTTKSDTGNVSVDLMQVDVTVGNIGYTTREETTTGVNLANGETTTNSLVVTTTSGDLTIRDTGV